MKIYAPSLHFSVLMEHAYIAQALGHTLTPARHRTHDIPGAFAKRVVPLPKEVAECDHRLNLGRETVRRFTDAHPELWEYDLFLIGHNPQIAPLFEEYGKPVVIQATTRYANPVTHDPVLMEGLNDRLRMMRRNGQLVVTTNNHTDTLYLEQEAKLPAITIPTIGAYTGLKWEGGGGRHYLHTRGDGWKNLWNLNDGFFGKFGSWEERAKAETAVILPYQTSTMSVFEMYAQGMPMLAPSQALLKTMRKARPDLALCETSYLRVHQTPYKGSHGRQGFVRLDDDLNPAWADQWVPTCDFYDPLNMPFVTYFNDPGELPERLRVIDRPAVSRQMLDHQQVREQQILSQWSKILRR